MAVDFVATASTLILVAVIEPERDAARQQATAIIPSPRSFIGMPARAADGLAAAHEVARVGLRVRWQRPARDSAVVAVAVAAVTRFVGAQYPRPCQPDKRRAPCKLS